MANAREEFVASELERILAGSDYRVGALVLTCAPEPGRGDVRILTAVMIKDLARDLAPDLGALPVRLRQLAAELERTYRGASADPIGAPLAD